MMIPQNPHGSFARPVNSLDFAQSRDDAASLTACEFIIHKFYLHDERYTAIDLAFEQHRDKKLFPQFVGNLVYWYDLDMKVDTYLADLAESQDRTVKSIALYHQARLIIERREWLQDEPERYDDILPDRMIRELQSANAKQRAKQLLVRVVELNPQREVPPRFRQTVGYLGERRSLGLSAVTKWRHVAGTFWC